ncbi:SMI1/KNR4 family protein [Saccharomonospora sp. NPDC006951]
MTEPGQGAEDADAPSGPAEHAVRKILTAPDDQVDDAIGSSALLLACTGAFAEADRLVLRWRDVTERPVTALAAGPVRARAWAMLFEARGARPEWARELLPLDLGAEERAHLAHLGDPGEKDSGDGLLAFVNKLGELTGGGADSENTARTPAQRLRRHAADAEALAAAGDRDGALAALGEWAGLAKDLPEPDVATLAACRHVAPLLVEGALTVPDEWARDYAGTLVAALLTRYRGERAPLDLAGLVAEIMRLRGEPHSTPPPATPAGIAFAEQRLGIALPPRYRDFLLTCDGLPGDVVFPRLLGVGELGLVNSVLPISEPPRLVLLPGNGAVVEWDPVFGTTTHPDIRAVLEEHLRLLEAAL